MAASNPLVIKYGLVDIQQWIRDHRGVDISLWEPLAIERLCIRGKMAGWEYVLLSKEERDAGMAVPQPSREWPIVDYGPRGPYGHLIQFSEHCWGGLFSWSVNMGGEIVVNHWAARCAWDFFNRGQNTPTDARYFITAGCASSGKTGVYSIIALTLFYCFPKSFLCRVGTTTSKGAEGRIWGQIAAWHRQGYFAKKSDMSSANGYNDGSFKILQGAEKRLLFYGRGENDKDVEKDTTRGIELVAIKHGADGKAAVQVLIGLKAHLKLLIIDEAPDVDQSVFSEDLMLNFSEAEIWAQSVYLGNPAWHAREFVEHYTPAKGWNDPDYHKGSRGWFTAKHGWVTQLYGPDTPNRDWKKLKDKSRKKNEPVAPFPYLLVKASIDRAKIACGGDDTPGYARMIEGWLCDENRNDTILTPKDIRSNGCEGIVEWTGEGRVALMGCDPAAGGDDFTVAIGWIGYGYTAKRERKVFLEVEDIRTIPYRSNDDRTADQQQVAQITTLASSYGIRRETISSDSTGFSKGFVALIENEMKGQIYRVNFAGRPTERVVSDRDPRKSSDAYMNGNSEIIMAVREYLPYLRGMTDVDMLDAFYMRKWTLRMGDKYAVEEKGDFKKRYGRSPDQADAVAVLIDLARTFGLGTDRLLIPGTMGTGRKEAWRNTASEMRFYAGQERRGGMMNYGAA